MPPNCPEQLLIALEPEAASIYCRKLRLHQVMDLSLQPITNGLDADGSRPFDSSFRQGKKKKKERESEWLLVSACGCLVFYFIIRMKPHCVPGNVVGFIHLGIVVFCRGRSVDVCVCVFWLQWRKARAKIWLQIRLWFCLMTLQLCVNECVGGLRCYIFLTFFIKLTNQL